MQAPGFSVSSGVPLPAYPTPINVVDGNGGFKSGDEATHPSNEIINAKHIFVVDSRQRDFKMYPTPNRYRINIGDVYKNITSLELKAAILPKTEYNIHSTNKFIDFAMANWDAALPAINQVGQQISGFKIKEGGRGYLPTPPFGTNPTPIVEIAPPVIANGVQATAIAHVNSGGEVYSVTVVDSGSGYLASKPPLVQIEPPPQLKGNVTAMSEAIAGTHYTAELREGQYTIGGNPGITVAGPALGLIKEIQNALNDAVTPGPYQYNSTAPFRVNLVSQYPDITAEPGTPEAFETNACLFNRIRITNVGAGLAPVPLFFELLWGSGPKNEINAHRVLGYEWTDYSPVETPEVQIDPDGAGAQVLIPAGFSIQSVNDWNMNDDPKYIVLSFWPVSNGDFERIESENEGLNRAFACLVFDANPPNVLNGLNTQGISTNGGVASGGIKKESLAPIMPGFTDNSLQLWGEVSKGSWWSPAGLTKALKGADFDQKYVSFSPPLGKLSYLDINFTKYGCGPGGKHYPYNFQGRDHLLIFEFSASDQNSQNRY